ncbi:MAG TPA: hypothetical protein VIP46_05955 [Pyrinomonadaceae bacterium]
MGDETREGQEGGGAATLAVVERSQFMPAMSIESAVERYNSVREFVGRVLRPEIDFGVIPGTEKLTLLKPGAEKLTTFFGLSTRFQLLERIEDWSGDAHGGEPFFYYLYRCQLHREELLVAEADGSCNSRETKYRWREAQRVCPTCGQAAIIRGREEFGGGWVCFRKKGGCGAKFVIGDPRIEGQQAGRVPNPDICDQVNTIQKMATKRALVAAVLIAVNASEFFTQDVEDFPARAPRAADATAAKDAARFDEGELLEGEILGVCHLLGGTEAQLSAWLLKRYAAARLAELTAAQKTELLALLNERLAKRRAA